MNLPENFVEGQTPMSETQFKLLLEDTWDYSFAFGMTLDIGILAQLIGE